MNNSSVRLRNWLFAGLALVLLTSKFAYAHGALAVGSTGDVAKDGYSIGINYNSATPEEARQGVLSWCWCRSHGSPLTKPKCELLFTFQHQCVSEAQDPKVGTPGVGWALGSNKEEAEKVALSNCRLTAGKARQQFCKIVNSVCDTTP
jgi:hypothetical protein